MKVADRLAPYETPPENALHNDDIRLWREHYIYNTAEADAYTHLLSLFNKDMSDELKDWLRVACDMRRAEADKANTKSRELTLELWRRP